MDKADEDEHGCSRTREGVVVAIGDCGFTKYNTLPYHMCKVLEQAGACVIHSRHSMAVENKVYVVTDGDDRGHFCSVGNLGTNRFCQDLRKIVGAGEFPVRSFRRA